MEIQQQEETCIREGAMELAAAANLSSSCGKSRPAGMIEPPRMLPNGIELSIHSCTKSVIREVRYIFPHLKVVKPNSNTKDDVAAQRFEGGGDEVKGEDSSTAAAAGDASVDMESILIIPTIQKSRVDTVRFGAEVEEEKDRCLEFFADFAKPVCTWLREQGHWADYIDPCSGLPVMTPDCTRPYSEVAGFEHLLRYKTQNAGCCKILLHPRWGSSCYPATIFTTAPLAILKQALEYSLKCGGAATNQ